MPMVVNTAMVEQPISSHSTTSSTRLRARSSGVMRLRTTRMVPMAMTRTSTVSAMRLMPRSCRYSADAARTASLTLAAGTLPATRLRTSLRTSESSLAGRSRTPAGRWSVTSRRMMASWKASHSTMTASAGSAHHIAVITP